ncbi:unnamed protein product [Arctia plantaginis]|uniref:Ionotropic receptor n=1 Tax=Arctia plantaginis TaxID=874455 RepID=A0A8S0YMQ3_ARCPL|nr:unnamed protein product [Arctia plantaginis]
MIVLSSLLMKHSLLKPRTPKPCFSCGSEDRPFAYPLIGYLVKLKDMVVKGINVLVTNVKENKINNNLLLFKPFRCNAGPFPKAEGNMGNKEFIFGIIETKKGTRDNVWICGVLIDLPKSDLMLIRTGACFVILLMTTGLAKRVKSFESRPRFRPLLKPLLEKKLLDKEKKKPLCGKCEELLLPPPPPPPPTIMLMPAGPPPCGAPPVPPILISPALPPSLCLPPPPPPAPLILPAPAPAPCLPAPPPMMFSLPPPSPFMFSAPPSPLMLPPPPAPIMLPAPSPCLPPAAPAPMILHAPQPAPLPCQCCLPPALPPAPAPFIISLVPPPPPPPLCAPPPPPPGIPMTAFMVPPPVPVTLEPKPLELPPPTFCSYQIKLTRQISQYGLSSTFSCNPYILDEVDNHKLQGVLYITHKHEDEMLEKLRHQHFFAMYKWLVVGDRLPTALHKIRYDADVTFLEHGATNSTAAYFSDTYIHPRDGVTIHPWAYWTATQGFIVTQERARILRRQDLKKYPLRIATPIGHYSSERYNGTFVDWLEDEAISDQDPGIRSGYHTSMLLVEAVNAQDLLIENELWSARINNDSMIIMLSTGDADLAGGILRILLDRTLILDYVVPIWPFRVGFIYVAERESSNNMYLEPFSPGVWWACLVMMCVLALVQRITSKNRKEEDGALYTVLTTYLQQDASAVPECASGRWSFMVLSVSAMLVHAYYTSAIVSALMSTGKGGPDSLRALGDSKYAIASEEYDFMRYLFFDVETSWEDLEYLKRKKMTSRFYVEFNKGVELVEQGSTAFHSEYNQIYPHFKSFSDDNICKLQHVDTIPETLTWITSSKNGQWTGMLRIAGLWLLETGLGKRLVTRLRIPQPPCRAALLAERVKLGDVAPLLLLTIFGAILSPMVLGMEVMFSKAQKYGCRILRRKTQAEFRNYESNLSEIIEFE